MSNPLLETWNTPFGLPPFVDIKAEHFEPAFEAAFAAQLAEIATICENEEDASFENTIEAYEISGALLQKVSAIFADRTSSHTSDALQKIQSTIAPRKAKHSTHLLQNAKLFERMDAVHKARSTLGLTQDQITLTEFHHRQFVRAGAGLSSDAKEKVAQLDQELSILTTSFGQNVLGATNAYELFVSEVDVEGLPGPAKSAAATAAKEKGRDGEYFFNTNRSSFLPLLQFADRREVREEIYNARAATATDGDFDNQRIAARISALRAERAKILGFKSHSDYVLDDRMAKTPQNAKGLLEDLWGPATKKAEEEADDLQERIRQDGGNFELKAWDWRYYAEKIKAERFDLDPDEVRQYFSLDNVREGAFFVAEKLYEISFDPLTDVPLPHEDCSAWEVKDKTGAHVGVFIADFFARPSKRDGAWMSTFRDQSNLNGSIRPIVKNTCNFARPVDGEPALLSFSDVRTLFHEFGHALHGLLSNVTYQSLSCTSVKWDFVELPSQIMEHWAMEPEVLRHYAKHAQTGEVIPNEIIKKLKAADTFNQGFETTGYLASSFLDLAWCSLETTQEQDTEQFESKAWSDLGLSDKLTPAHRTPAFSHVFSGGYSAGYYSYIWAAVLDCDGFEAFAEKGIFDPETAVAFKENVLEKGGTEEPMELYKKFRGREPSVDALLKNRGLD